ncbi:MAG: cation diffusion facilitator family transporter [Microthrixaceae bacterium]
MSHDHHHGPAAGRAGERHRRPLTIALALVVVFLVVQVVTGWLTGSLSLLSDAGHMATDALGLAMALAAIHLASRSTRRSARTFGLYRLEIFAALANAVLLFGVAGYVLFEAVERLRSPTEVASVPVLVVGLLGLAVNVVSFLLLREGAAESINLEGAYLEVVADMLGSIGVVVGAAVIWSTGWTWVDPIVGAAIGIFILPRAYRLGREALRILLQQAPAGADLAGITTSLTAIDGVVDVHDLHLWTLTSDMEVLTAHVMTDDDTDAHGVLDRAREVLSADHGISHATLQVEPSSHHGCEELDW